MADSMCRYSPGYNQCKPASVMPVCVGEFLINSTGDFYEDLYVQTGDIHM